MNARDRRAARHQPPGPEGGTPDRPRRRKEPITVKQVVDTALEVIATEGYEALTMRRLATALDTGPASLYAHVVNKSDLDELLIARLCSEITLPDPDPETWPDQIRSVCTLLRDQYLKYPGISRAALAMAPTGPETLRLGEGMLGILLAGGIEPQAAAWAIDALFLYVAASCLELSVVEQRKVSNDAEWVVDPAELRRRLAGLPVGTFPYTVRYAREMTAGRIDDRFGFTLGLMIRGLTPGAP